MQGDEETTRESGHSQQLWRRKREEGDVVRGRYLKEEGGEAEV